MPGGTRCGPGWGRCPERHGQPPPLPPPVRPHGVWCLPRLSWGLAPCGPWHLVARAAVSRRFEHVLPIQLSSMFIPIQLCSSVSLDSEIKWGVRCPSAIFSPPETTAFWVADPILPLQPHDEHGYGLHWGGMHESAELCCSGHILHSLDVVCCAGCSPNTAATAPGQPRGQQSSVIVLCARAATVAVSTTRLKNALRCSADWMPLL